ncbi:hypothetical protein Droror1_Dr00001513 [Drosera rotundifolia]
MFMVPSEAKRVGRLYCPTAPTKESCYVWSRTGDRNNGSWIRQYAFNLTQFSYPVLSWKNLMLLNDGTGKNLTFVYRDSDDEKRVVYLDKRPSCDFFVLYESLLSIKS